MNNILFDTIKLLRYNKNINCWLLTNHQQSTSMCLLKTLLKYTTFQSISQFISIAEMFDNPEDIAEPLACSLSLNKKIEIFMIIFELWKRHLPYKQSLSILCYNLDCQIYSYSLNNHDQIILDSLIYDLLNIINSSIEQGSSMSIIIDHLQKFFVNRLDVFLFKYFLHQHPFSHSCLEFMLKHAKSIFGKLRGAYFINRLNLNSNAITLSLASLSNDSRCYQDPLIISNLLSSCINFNKSDLFISIFNKYANTIKNEKDKMKLLIKTKNILKEHSQLEIAKKLFYF